MDDIEHRLPKNVERYLAALSRLYAQDGRRLLQEIVVNAQARVTEGWIYDNWNGGTYGHALYLVLPEPVFLAAPTSSDARLKRSAAASRGFVYAVSRTGVTGARKQVSEDAQTLVRRLRKFTRLPIAVGFGISTPEQFVAVGEYADAAVVGSAIVETIERNLGNEPASVGEFVRRLFAVSCQSPAKTL